jgi:hypothetical protein
MKRVTVLLPVCLLISLLLFSCRHPFVNPVDPESEEYIGTESKDNDGDGIGQWEDVDEITLVSPKHGETITKFPLTLTTYMLNPENVRRYWIQISTSNATFESPELIFSNDDYSTNECEIPPGTLTSNGPYYWRAMAHDGNKWSDSWSDTWSFAVSLVVVNPTTGLITSEPGGIATFSVSLNDQPEADVTIGLSSSDTTEGTVSPSSLTFTTVNWSTPQTVTVTGVDDYVPDNNQSYTIVTAQAISGDENYNGFNPSDVSATNTDEDIPGFVVNPTSGLVTTEPGGTASFTIRLSTQPAADVTIGLSSSDTTEGTVSPSSLTFTTVNWSTPQTVTVTGVDDFEQDGPQSYSISTASASSGDSDYNGRNPPDVSVTNTDDDIPAILVNPSIGLVTTEGGGMASFTIVLTTQPSSNVTIGLSSSDTTEGTVSPSSVMFTSSNWGTPQTATVTGVDDYKYDGSQSYTILTGAASSADADYSGRNPPDVSVTNSDNDPPPGITVNPTGGLVTTEWGETASFTIVLTTQPSSNVTIGLSSSDTTEGTVSPSGVTFTSSNWGTPQTATVTGVDDYKYDGSQSYTILTGAATSGDPDYSGRNPPDVSVTNSDNDPPPGITVNPTAGLVTTEWRETASFTIVLTTQPSSNVTIGLSSSDTTEGTVSPSSVTFTSSNWGTPRTVTVTGVNDFEIDGNPSYSVVTGAASSADPDYNGRDPLNVSASNSDNDYAGRTIIITVKDCTTDSSLPDSNLNADALTVLYSSGNYYASLVYFSLSSLPSGATIDSAYLTMYCNLEIGSTTLRIGRLADSPSWSETSVTWNNMPYGTTPPAFAYFPVTSNTWNNYNVTQFVDAWWQATYTNSGFQLFTTVSETGAMFYNRETGSSWAPYLDITWRVLQ